MFCVVIGGGVNQLFLVDALLTLGFRIVLIDKDAECPCREKSFYFINGSTHNEAGWIDELITFDGKNKLAEIFTASSGPPIRVAARVARRFGIRLFPESAAMIATSKIAFRGEFSGGKEVFNDNWWPKMLRADYSILGKNSCRVAYNSLDLAEKKRELQRISISKNILIERYVEGIDLIVIGMVSDTKLQILGHLVEVNEVNARGCIVGLGLYTTNLLTSSLKNELEKLLRFFVTNYEIINAPITLSVRVAESGILPIEVHLDFGGESVFDWLVKAYYAEGLVSVLRALLGSKKINTSDQPESCHAVIYQHEGTMLPSLGEYCLGIAETSLKGKSLACLGDEKNVAKFFDRYRQCIF